MATATHECRVSLIEVAQALGMDVGQAFQVAARAEKLGIRTETDWAGRVAVSIPAAAELYRDLSQRPPVDHATVAAQRAPDGVYAALPPILDRHGRWHNAVQLPGTDEPSSDALTDPTFGPIDVY